MIRKINDNKNVFSSIVYEVNKTVKTQQALTSV